MSTPPHETPLHWTNRPAWLFVEVWPRWWPAVLDALFRVARAAGCSQELASGVAALGLALLHAQQEGSTGVSLDEVPDRLASLLLALSEAASCGMGESDEFGAGVSSAAIWLSQARATATRILSWWVDEGAARIEHTGASGAGERAAVRRVLGAFESGEPTPGFDTPLLVRLGGPGGGLLQSERLFRMERHLAEALVARSVGVASEPRRAWDVGEEGVAGAERLHPLQRRAVVHAMRFPLTVVSGGPGTGKTTVVASLLRTWLWRARKQGATFQEAAARIALSAPTGKAADRMRESLAGCLEPLRGGHEEVAALLGTTAPRPITLHRLLGYSPGRDRFRYGRARPLPHELVVIDEASMLDMELALVLLEALADGAHLVLLGDPGQLPAVGLGAVLRDLREAALEAEARGAAAFSDILVHLTENHRVHRNQGGRALLRFAERVAEGGLASIEEVEEVRVVPLDAVPSFQGVEVTEAPNADARRRALRRWYEAHIEAVLRDAGYYPGSGRGRPPWVQEEDEALRYLELLGRGKVLAAVRRGPGSVREANDLLSFLHAAVLGRRGVAGAGWMEGVPAIVTRNDYGLGLYNGDLGVVLLSGGGAGAHYRFVLAREGRVRSWPLMQVYGALRPAWAMTVHKAQGSEFDHVVLCLPERFGPPLGRELLYTAITRARRSVWVVGRLAVLREAAGRRDRRRTGLPAALWEAENALSKERVPTRPDRRS